MGYAGKVRWRRALPAFAAVTLALACGRKLAVSDGPPGAGGDGGGAPEASSSPPPPAAIGPSCDGSACDCNGDPADGLETIVSSAGSHCGRCGRACTLGVCREGACQLAPVGGLALLEPVDLLATEEELHITASGTAGLVRLNLSGGVVDGPFERLGGVGPAGEIAQGGEGVFWTELDGGLYRRAADCVDAACRVRIAALDQAPDAGGLAYAVAARADSVFWTRVRALPSGPYSELLASKLSSSGAPDVAASWQLERKRAAPGELLSLTHGDDQRLYYGLAQDGALSVRSIDVDCTGECEDTEHFTLAAEDEAFGLVVSEGRIFHTVPSKGELRVRSGVVSSVLAANEPGIRFAPILVGADDLYWLRLTEHPDDGGADEVQIRHRSLRCTGAACEETVAYRSSSPFRPIAFAVTSARYFFLAVSLEGAGALLYQAPR